MNQNNVLLIKKVQCLRSLSFLSYMTFREDVRMPRRLMFSILAELLLDKSSFYSIVTGFLSRWCFLFGFGFFPGFFVCLFFVFGGFLCVCDRKLILPLLIHSGYIWICQQCLLAVNFRSSSLWSQLHPQLASSASQFVLMLRIGSI